MKIFDELLERGLVKQTTNPDKIRQLLNEQQITFYIGFDPTADSLHVGHLLQLITARRLISAGHRAILLIGGATATVGDPTGKTEMRKNLSLSTTYNNSEKITSQIRKIVGEVEIVNNMAWFDSLSFLSMLREIAPHFSVNNMLRADCFQSRMENGLSFLEFNYMIMQAFDFFRLHQEENCLLQVGGDDQWSNILAGIDLTHKKDGTDVFGMTLPLLTNSAGQKMGKTEKGAIWLSADKTSAFDFFQFWRNIPDEEVKKCFNMLTHVSVFETETADFSSVEKVNWAKKQLAFELTKVVHGELVALEILKQVESLFENRDTSIIEAVSITDGVQILDLLVQNNFAKSRNEARNLIKNHGVVVNDQILDDPTLIVTRAKFGDEISVRKGKKNFGRFVIKDPDA